MEKSQLRKRFESFLWRLGGMVLAAGLVFLGDNMELLHIPAQAIPVLGLVIGEVTKILNPAAKK